MSNSSALNGRTAIARMSKSKFRTVTTVLQLESGDVIRAKDREALARVMAKRRESRASTGGQGEESTSQVGTGIEEMPRDHSKYVEKADAASLYKTLLAGEDSSQSVKITRRASATNANEAATEHAIPDIRQIQSEGINDPSTDIKKGDNQAVEPYAALTLSDIDRSENPPAAVDTGVNSPQSSPKRNSSPPQVRNGVSKSKNTRRNARKSQPSARTSLEQPRPRRSGRKASTSHPKAEVDWSEDIRPTDEEKSPKLERGTSKGTSVSSLEAESNESSRKKRKAAKAKPRLGKRQKAIKTKDSISAQLRLAADIGEKVQPETVKPSADPATNLQDEQLDNAGGWDAIDLAAPSLPVLDEGDPNEHQAACRGHEIIELSSDSLLPSNLSSPRQDTVSPRSNEHKAQTKSHGRGVIVAQKLTDALRDAGLHAQCPPVVSRFSSRSVGRTASEVAEHRGILLTQAPRVQNPFSSEPEMIQYELSPVITAGDQNGPHKSELISMTNTHTQQMTNVSAKIIGSPIKYLSDIRKLMNSTGYLERKRSGDQADDPLVIPDDSPQAAHMPDMMEIEIKLHDTGQASPRGGLMWLKGNLDTSSQGSETFMLDGTSMSPDQGRESEHTPESQKPLLSVHTCQKAASLAVPKSITRSSIVDRNGSPRLCPQRVGKPHLVLDRFLPQSIKIADSSSSEYDEDSGDYYSESKYQLGKTWSRFKRDMFMEYGIGPEELTPVMAGSSLFGDDVRVDSCADKTHAAATDENTDILHEDKHEECSLIERSVAHDDRASTIAPCFIPRSMDEPGMEAEDDAHNLENHEKRLSTGGSGSGSHRLLLEGDLDHMDWIPDLQAAQQSAHGLLLETNQYLSSQLVAEQDSIRQVLQIYQQGCHRILDSLSRAHEVRMQLYRQQMSSVKEQHNQICQELIQGLQELDHRVQQDP